MYILLIDASGVCVCGEGPLISLAKLTWITKLFALRSSDPKVFNLSLGAITRKNANM